MIDFLTRASEPCPCSSGRDFKNCCGGKSGKIPGGIFLKKNIFSEKKCNEMVRYLSDRNKKWLGTVTSTDEKGKNDFAVNETRIAQAVDRGKYKKFIQKKVEDIFSELINGLYGETLFWFEDPNVLYYKSGGRYLEHADSENLNSISKEWIKFTDRDYSMLLYISDEFEGGEINFCRFGYKYRPRKGDLLFFPSDNRYVHRAEPVKSGHRFVIVSWCSVNESIKTFDQIPKYAILAS